MALFANQGGVRGREVIGDSHDEESRASRLSSLSLSIVLCHRPLSLLPAPTPSNTACLGTALTLDLEVAVRPDNLSP